MRQRRDVVLVVLASVIVAALGVALLWPDGEAPATAGGDGDVTSSTAPLTTVPRGGADDASGAPDGDSATSPGDAAVSSDELPLPDQNGDGDVVTSVIQPDIPGDAPMPQVGEKADAIGPFGDRSRREAGDELALGDVNAPVVMVVYSDYRCPYCALFSQTLEQDLIDEYVTPGVLRIEWRDFPMFGDESARAAVAGRAAALQGKFWEFNRALYAAAPEHGHPALPDETLIAFADAAGVEDLDEFATDLDNPDLIDAVQTDFDDGIALGVPATPSFIINGFPLQGARPLSEFQQLIDTALMLHNEEAGS